MRLGQESAVCVGIARREPAPDVRTSAVGTTERGRPMAAEAYCVKCKTKREMQDAVQIQMKNGRPATEGKCPVCGTKMFKIGAAG